MLIAKVILLKAIILAKEFARISTLKGPLKGEKIHGTCDRVSAFSHIIFHKS